MDNKLKEEFKSSLTDMLRAFLDFNDGYENNPQVRVNPEDFTVDLADGRDLMDSIEDSDEVIEDGAAAESPVAEDSADYQASRNPDFYPVKQFITLKDGKRVIDMKAVDKLADTYFK